MPEYDVAPVVQFTGGPQIWYGDSIKTFRLDLEGAQGSSNHFNRRDLRIIKALLEESLTNINELLDLAIN